MDQKIASFKILMFPWLAHGHIFPYLELAKRILKRKNFHIYLCSTAINFSSINNFIDKNLLSNSIELVQLHLEPNSELPPHYHTTKNLPSNLSFTLLKAIQTGCSSFSDIINTLKPDLVIYDVFQPWAAKLALSQGIPAVHFGPFGATTYSVMHHRYNSKDDFNFPSSAICLTDNEIKSLDDLVHFLSVNVFNGEKDGIFLNHKLSTDILLLKTSRGFEGKYIDHYSSVSMKKVIPLGPLVQDEDNINNNDDENSDIIDWLSKKTPFSTVYISFGSEYFLSKNEIEEIAKGLELCHDVNFIWVIRFPVGETISLQEVLPDGFFQRVKDRGIVVEKWAPQAKILGHPSTAGFMSHCGWSSVNESIYYCVPIIGMPMKINMFIDARLLVENGVGVEVSRDENNVYKGEELAKAINEVVIEKSGQELRRKVSEVSNKMKMEEEEEIDAAADQLWQLCLKKKEQLV